LVNVDNHNVVILLHSTTI